METRTRQIATITPKDGREPFQVGILFAWIEDHRITVLEPDYLDPWTCKRCEHWINGTTETDSNGNAQIEDELHHLSLAEPTEADGLLTDGLDQAIAYLERTTTLDAERERVLPPIRTAIEATGAEA